MESVLTEYFACHFRVFFSRISFSLAVALCSRCVPRDFGRIASQLVILVLLRDF